MTKRAYLKKSRLLLNAVEEARQYSVRTKTYGWFFAMVATYLDFKDFALERKYKIGAYANEKEGT